MNINKNVYKYIEYELYNYSNSKKELEDLKLEIIEAGKEIDGQPKNNNISNPTEEKVLKIVKNANIEHLTKIIKSINNTLDDLDSIYTKIFMLKYMDKQNTIYICDNLGLSESTYYRYKNKLVLKVGKKIGIIK